MLRCRADDNEFDGIATSGNTTVADCIAEGNGLHGIGANLRCHIRGNTCGSNGDASNPGYGILVHGSGSRIEGNHCFQNTRGISVSGTNNLIIRNSVHGNTEFGFFIAGGNMFGPNLVPAGNPIATNNNPHANYEL